MQLVMIPSTESWNAFHENEKDSLLVRSSKLIAKAELHHPVVSAAELPANVHMSCFTACFIIQQPGKNIFRNPCSQFIVF